MNKVSIILTNYKRPWNIPKQISSISKINANIEIVLIDNDCDNLLQLGNIDNVKHIRMGYNSGAGFRFLYATECYADMIVCIDDDVLLQPTQIGQLIDHALLDTERLHGVWGQRITQRENKPWLQGGIFCVESQLDVLNRVYAFTPSIAAKALGLASQLGFKCWSEIGPIDDILMSFAEVKKPMCWNFGPITECITSNDEEIAVWKQHGFQKRRRDIVSAILKIRGASN